MMLLYLHFGLVVFGLLFLMTHALDRPIWAA